MKKFLAAFIAIMCLSGCYYVDTGVHPNYYARQSRTNHVYHYDSHFYRKETHKVKKPKPAKHDIKPAKAPKKYEPKHSVMKAGPKKYEPKHSVMKAGPKKYKPKAPKKYKPKALETKSGGSTKISHGGINPNKKKY